MADWKKLLVENPPASDIASSPSSGKVLKVSSNGTGLEWADDAGGAFTDNGSTATVTDRIVTITGSSSAIPTLDINPPSSASTASYSRIRVQTSGKDLRFNLRNGSSTSDVMTIGHDGDVGIGRTSPSSTLDVAGDANIDTKLWLGNTHNGGQTWASIGNKGNELVLDGGSDSGLTIVTGTSNAGYINHNNYNNGNYQHIKFDSANAGMFFKAGGTDNVLSLKSTGVGIGTSSPGASLEISGGASKSLLVNSTSGTSTISAQKDGNYVKLGANGTSGFIKYGNTTTSTARDLIFFEGGGSETMRLTDAGRLGIGTTSPSDKLHVADTGTDSDGRIRTSSQNVTSSIGSAEGDNRYFFAGAGLEIMTNTNHDIRFGTNVTAGNATPKMVLDTSGRLGIGTSSPLAKLNVDTSSNAIGLLVNATDGNSSRMQFTNSSTGSTSSDGFIIGLAYSEHADIMLNEPSKSIRFKTNGDNTRMVINENGRVGIGTTSPTNKLQINHNSSTSLGLYVAHSADEYGGLAKFYTNSSNNTARSLVEIHSDNASSSNIIPLKIIQDAGSTALHVVGEILTTGNLQVEKSYPDIMTKSSNEGRIGFMDAGGSIRSGMKNGGTGILKFIAGGNVERMRITTDGIVGINTTSPNSNSILHIVDGAGTMPTTHAGDSLIVQNNANTTDVSAIYAIAGTAGSSHIVFGDADSKNPGRVSYYHNSDYMSFHTNTTEQMRITSAGNVGIGETAPTQALTLGSGKHLKLTGGIAYGIREFNRNANNQSTIILGGNGANANYDARIELYGQNANYGKAIFNYGYTNASKLQFQVLGNDKVVFSGNGSVGIGTSSPSAKFEVQPNNSSLTDNSALGLWIRGNNGGIKIGRHTGNDGAYAHIYVDNASSDHCYIRTYDTTNGGIATDVIGGADNNPVNNQIKLQSYKQTHNILGNTVFVLDSSSRISLSNNDDGASNTVFGKNAGNDLASGGNYSAFFGENAGANITTGDGNVAIGYAALQTADDDGRNIAIGQEALKVYNHSGDTYNVAVGHRSQYARTGGVQNTALGAFSQYGATSGTAPSGSGNTSVGYLSLNFITNGQYNSVLGLQAGYKITSAVNNSLIGYQTGYNITTGFSNVGLGREALKSLVNGTMNVAIGNNALVSETGGDTTVAIGQTALYSQNVTYGVDSNNVGIGYLTSYYNVTGVRNTAIGANALKGASGQSHSNNTAIGYGSLQNTTTGGNNVGIGINALVTNTTGLRNVSIGDSSMYNNTTGGHNVAIGRLADFNAVSGSYNVSIGHEAMYGVINQVHENSVAIGYQSMYKIQNGTQNTAVGSESMWAITTGGSNVAVGCKAGNAMTDNFGNVAIGTEAFAYANSGESYNIGIGYRAGHGIDNSLSDHSILIGRNAGSGGSGKMDACVVIGGFALNATGANNKTGEIAIGYESLTGATTGYGNLAIGHRTSKSLTTGNFNISIGYESGRNQTTASSNTFIGYQSGRATSGSNNVAVGKYAMYEGAGADGNTAIGTNALQNITGDNNVAVGSDSLNAQTSGSDNTSVGAGAGLSVTTGYDNSLLGKFAGKGLTTGDGNTLIGDGAGDNITQGRRNTVIGKGATTSANGALDQIVIGWGATGVGDTSAMIGGSQVTDVYMGDNGSSWSTTSDGRLKENIEEWTTGLDAINKLRIVEYNFKEDNPYNYNHKKKRQGIIAQEAIEAIPEMIKDDGEWLSANQEPMIWALVNAVQELTKKVNELETKLNKEN